MNPDPPILMLSNMFVTATGLPLVPARSSSNSCDESCFSGAEEAVTSLFYHQSECFHNRFISHIACLLTLKEDVLYHYCLRRDIVVIRILSAPVETSHFILQNRTQSHIWAYSHSMSFLHSPRPNITERGSVSSLFLPSFCAKMLQTCYS